MTIDVLAEQIEWLRWQLTQTPHMSEILRPAATPADTQLLPEPGGPMWLSEEEEDLLALKLNDHLDREDVEAIRSELRLPSLEVSE